MSQRNLADAIREVKSEDGAQAAMFAPEPIVRTPESRDARKVASVVPFGAIIPPGMKIIYSIDEMPGYVDLSQDSWVEEHNGVWHNTQTDHWFVEHRPGSVSAQPQPDCESGAA